MQLEYAPLLNAISCSQFMIDYRSSKTLSFANCMLPVALMWITSLKTCWKLRKKKFGKGYIENVSSIHKINISVLVLRG